MKRMRGAALLWVLWILMIGTALVAISLQRSASHSAYSSLARQQSQQQAIAEAGLTQAIWQIDARSGLAQQMLPDGRIHTLQFADTPVQFRITDETAKIDLNAAPAELLTAYFRQLGQSEALANGLTTAILAQRRSNGVGSPGSGQGWHAVQALANIPGFDSRLLARCRKDFSVLSGMPLPNRPWASEPVRAAMATQQGYAAQNIGLSTSGMYRIDIRVRPKTGPASHWQAVIRLVAFDPTGRGYRVLSWQPEAGVFE